MKVQELVEYWCKHFCVFCKTKNWTYHSHSQRHYTGTYLNTNACKCWKCGKSYWLVDSIEMEPVIQDGNPTAEIRRSSIILENRDEQ